jgi:hypothetical protein
MTIITLPTYQKHWIHTRPYGHDIVIWCDTGKTTIECRWQDTERDTNGRVKQKEKNNDRKDRKDRKDRSDNND